MKTIKLSLFFILIFFGCEELPDLSQNPFEADEEDQIPEINLLESSINGNTAVLAWYGNKFALEYRYKILFYNNILDQYTDYDEWSEWGIDSSLYLTNLDEGDYRFFIETHFNYDKVNFDSIDFKIDNISSNSIRIFPLIKNTYNNEEFYIEVYFEDVYNVAGINLDINFYSSDVKCENFIWGSVINEINFNYESMSITPEPVIYENSVKLDAVFSGNGFSGSGSIVKLIFSSKSDWSETQIFINDASIFDIDGNEIMINELVGGLVRKIND